MWWKQVKESIVLESPFLIGEFQYRIVGLVREPVT